METKIGARTFIDEIAAAPGGEGIRLCIQCGTCTASCPSAARWEYTPSEIIAMVRAGMREEVLSSSSMWHCLSCYFCTVRCPRGVKPTDLFHALESVAIQNGYQVKNVRTPAMYQSFVRSIRGNGRVHEFGVMLGYYLSTNPFAMLKLAPEGLRLFRHKRMPLSPKKVRGREDLAKITAKLRQIRGGQ
jgi:heterodisulfide reductase subunit C